MIKCWKMNNEAFFLDESRVQKITADGESMIVFFKNWSWVRIKRITFE